MRMSLPARVARLAAAIGLALTTILPAASSTVAQEADVELATLDVLLDQGRVLKFPLDGDNTLEHVPGVVHQRIGANAQRRIVAQRFDKKRHAQMAACFQIIVRGEHRKIRKWNTLPGQQLLGKPFISTDVELSRASSCIRHTQQFQHSSNPHIAQEVTFGKGFEQIKDEIGLTPRQTRHHALEVAVHPQDRHLVPAFLQGRGYLFERRGYSSTAEGPSRAPSQACVQYAISCTDGHLLVELN